MDLKQLKEDIQIKEVKISNLEQSNIDRGGYIGKITEENLNL